MQTALQVQLMGIRRIFFSDIGAQSFVNECCLNVLEISTSRFQLQTQSARHEHLIFTEELNSVSM